MTLAEQEILEPLALSRNHAVVLVDDDPAVLAALRRALRREPYSVRATSFPDIALEWIERGDVSLVVLDQRMPGMCGTELADRVARISPNTVRVMLTAYAGDALVEHGLARDIQWLISKPWNDDALRLTIRRLLRELEPAAVPEPRRAGFAWNRIEWAMRRAALAFVQGTRWIVGFLWMADAGGAP